MRYQLALRLEQSPHDVDVFRQVRNGDNSRVQVLTNDATEILDFPVPPIRYLRDYRYSIVTENFVDDLYFTEKILNCFATGTVPIYRGASLINTVFDEQGIIPWSTPADLQKRILPSLSPDDYSHRMSAIKNNFRLAKKFTTIEDFIVSKYLGEITTLR